VEVITRNVGDGIVPAHVEVSVVGYPAGTDHVTVTRRAQKRTWEVRDFIERSVRGDLFARDFEWPFGLPFVYEAAAYDEGGETIAAVRSTPITRHSPRPGSIAVHDPLRPAHQMTLMLETKATKSGSRSVGVELLGLQGRSVPLASGSLRAGWSGVAFDAVTFSQQQAVAFDSMFGGYDDEDQASGVLCIRPAANVPVLVPRTFFASVPDPTPEPYYPEEGRTETVWRLEATEVAPPAPTLVDPLVTWADWTAWQKRNHGWRGLQRAFPTWQERNRTLVPYGWADRPEERYASWKDWQEWLRDNGGWPAFNARFATWAASRADESIIGWASR
jgi:hypothetical protein